MILWSLFCAFPQARVLGFGALSVNVVTTAYGPCLGSSTTSSVADSPPRAPAVGPYVLPSLAKRGSLIDYDQPYGLMGGSLNVRLLAHQGLLAFSPEPIIAASLRPWPT